MEGSVAINQRLAIAAVNRRNEMIPSGKAVEFDLQVPETEGVYNLEWYSGEVDGNRYVETAGITVKVSAFSGEFPCVLFGIDPWNSSVQLNAQTANINGNIGTNGKFSTTASNLNVNGTITENDHRNIEIIGERLTEQYFSGRNIQSVSENYEVTDNNINISNPIEVEGEINLDGNVSLNSGLSATEDVVIDGGNVNGNNSLIYSEKGNITVDASNKSYLGVIYAPAGTVEITSPSIHIQGVIIAQNIILNGDNITVTHDSNIAKIVGNTLDVTDDISLIGSKRTPMSDILANSKSLVSPSDLNKFFYDWSSGVVLSPDSGN
jgi:hypothetical protein